MVDAVSPIAEKPKHHITLSDGVTTVGLIAVKTGTDKSGEIITNQDENAIDVRPSQPLAIQTSQGNSQYSDREWPYMTLIQEDWSGGRGGETFEDDKTRYFDGNRVDTWREGELMLGPLETYVSLGFGELEQSMPGETASSGVTWSSLYGAAGTRFWSTSWVQDGTWTCGGEVEVILRKIGSPANGVAIRLCSDDGGDPGTTRLQANNTADVADYVSGISYIARISLDTTYEFQDGLTYHIEVGGAGDADATDHWDVGTATGTTTGKYSNNQSTYIGSQRALYYRILENYTATTKQQTGIVTFEYKGAFYAYTQPPATNSFLFINGDRGVADSNTGNLGTLKDTSKNWADDLYNGWIVKITAGPGSEEKQPWRTVVNTVNNGGSPYVTVLPAWNIEHTTATEYVFLGGNDWTSLLDLGGYVTDHVVTEDYAYFARGETGSDKILRYRWYNNAGAEATGSDAENIEGKYLLAVHHPEDEHDTLYIVQNDHPQHGVAIGKMKAPGTWNDLVFPMGKLAETNTPWDDRSITNVTQTTDEQATKVAIADGFGTGIVAVKNLDAPIDITQANNLGLWIKTDKATASKLHLAYGDFADTDGNVALTRNTPANEPIKQTAPGAVYFFGYPSPTAPDIVLLDEAMDGTEATHYMCSEADAVGDVTHINGSRLQADGNLIVMADYKFNDIYIACGTHDGTAETISTLYWNGHTWVSLTSTDNTSCLASDDSITFTAPENWEQITVTDGTVAYTGYAVSITFSGQLTDDITIQYIVLSQYNTTASSRINLGALTANEWKYVVVSITPEQFPAPDDTQVQTLGLYLDTDLGAQNIWLRDGIDLLYDEPDWKPLPSNDKITNTIAYNGNVNEPRTNPWIFTEGAQIYEMQTQNDDQFIPMTIGEMGAFRSENTGVASCINDVYLYFGLGEEKIQRWFNNSLEDVGPDIAGMPSARKGRITALLSYPGRVYAAMSDASNTSSVLMLRGSSWHEVYRAPRAAAKINNLYHQRIPGDTVGWLWFDLDGDLMHIPVTSGDPREADSYEFTHDGQVETGWFYAGMKDIVKIWNELKIFAENVGSNYYVEADYKADADSTWTTITGTFDTEPSEALDIASTPPRKKRMKIRLRLYSKYTGDTPEIKAMLIEDYGVTDIKYVCTFPFVVADEKGTVDLQGNKQKALGYAALASTAIQKLANWANDGTPLTANSTVAVFDSRTVVLEGPPLRPIRIDNVAQKEKYLLNLVCRDV